MPPKKRTAGPGSRSKRLHSLPPASDLQEAEPAAIVQDIQSTAAPGMIQLNLQALTGTIDAAVSAAVKDAMASQDQAGVPGSSTTALGQVEHLVHEEITDLTQPTGTQGAGPLFSTLNFREEPRQLFISIGVDLGARCSSKTKARISANEYIDFGVLLSVAPPRERYALSMTSSGGVLGQPHLTLEAYHGPKKVTTIQQWITAFNIFVSIYSEKAAGDAPKLMRYCEVVRGLSHKSAD